MLTNLRLAELRLSTAQQRTTGQDLSPDLYKENILLMSNVMGRKMEKIQINAKETTL
jgi:hypothetical protein